MLTDYDLEKKSFCLWLAENGETNQTDIIRLRKMVPVAMKECCTGKQLCYITHFFADRMMMKDIAALYGVNTSTVSRTISAGLRKMRAHLKYCSPELCTSAQDQGRLTQGKIGRKNKEYIP